MNPGSQNCKLGSGRISKMATITENSKNKISFFELWHGTSTEHKYSKLKNEKKNLLWSFVTVTYFLFTSVILFIFPCLIITYLNNFLQLLL